MGGHMSAAYTCVRLALVPLSDQQYISVRQRNPDSKVHGANMGPIWGLQDPGGPHVGPMNFAIWEGLQAAEPAYVYASLS